MQDNSSQGTQWGNLIAAVATVPCSDIATGLVLQLLPLLMERQNYLAWVIGLNAAMGPIGILLAGPFMPRIIVRFGSKAVAATAIVTIIASLACFKLLPFLWAWFLVRLVFGIFVGFLFVISESWVLTFSGEKSRGRIMGFYTSVLAMTFAVGPLVLPITGIDGWLPWAIGIACVAASAVPLLLVDIKNIDFASKGGGAFLGFVGRAPLLLLCVLTVTLFDSVFISFFTIFAMRSGLSMSTGSTILGVAIISNILLFTPLGMLADRWSRNGVLILSAALTVGLCLSLPFVVTSWLVWPVTILISAAAFGPYIIALATVGDRFTGADLIAGSAAFTTMWGVGGLIGPPIAGAAIDAFGINAMPVTVAAFHGLLFLLTVFGRGKLVREEALGQP